MYGWVTYIGSSYVHVNWIVEPTGEDNIRDDSLPSGLPSSSSQAFRCYGIRVTPGGALSTLPVRQSIGKYLRYQVSKPAYISLLTA